MTTKNGNSINIYTVTMIDLALGSIEIGTMLLVYADLVANKKN